MLRSPIVSTGLSANSARGESPKSTAAATHVTVRALVSKARNPPLFGRLDPTAVIESAAGGHGMMGNTHPLEFVSKTTLANNVPPVRIELTTFRLQSGCSNRLS